MFLGLTQLKDELRFLERFSSSLLALCFILFQSEDCSNAWLMMDDTSQQPICFCILAINRIDFYYYLKMKEIIDSLLYCLYGFLNLSY